MVVSKEITRLENSAVQLTVTVGKDDVRGQYDELLTDYTRKVLIPGFRKGKVPRDVLVRKFGDALKEEALSNIIGKSVKELFETPETLGEDLKPLPYTEPELKGEPKFDLESDLTFSVVYDVLPKAELPRWQGTEIEIPDVEIGKEDIDRELESIRDRNALILDRDDGAGAAKNDVATVTYCELNEQGEAIPGSERADYVFTLGSGMVAFKFDDDALGMKKGESREFDKSFPDDYEDPVLAGKTKKFKITLTALKEKKLPDLDDDLAQDVNEKFQTLDDLKNDIKDKLGKKLEARTRELKINAFLEKLLEKTDIAVPESMMRLELDSRWNGLARRFNVTSEQLLKMYSAGSKGYDEVLDEWRPSAKKALQSRIIVETMMKNMNIEVSGEELEKEFETMAANAELKVDEVKNYYGQGNMTDYLKEDIREKKLFDAVFGEITIKKGEKRKFLDLMGNNG
ncbi:MAG: trigger factor [Spirochaetaceae bacterium]|nr:trigger factor [Spirochaetaceae bacterium]